MTLKLDLSKLSYSSPRFLHDAPILLNRKNPMAETIKWYASNFRLPADNTKICLNAKVY